MGTNATCCDYKTNFAFAVPHDPCQPHTSQRAELYAAVGALIKARLYVQHGRQYRCGNRCIKPCTVKHIVLKTDSAYLAHGITSYIKKWRHNGWQTSNRTDVKNRDLWETLDGYIDDYQNSGVGVDFWLVPRELNRNADMLTRMGLGMSVTFTLERGFGWEQQS